MLTCVKSLWQIIQWSYEERKCMLQNKKKSTKTKAKHSVNVNICFWAKILWRIVLCINLASSIILWVKSDSLHDLISQSAVKSIKCTFWPDVTFCYIWGFWGSSQKCLRPLCSILIIYASLPFNLVSSFNFQLIDPSTQTAHLFSKWLGKLATRLEYKVDVTGTWQMSKGLVYLVCLFGHKRHGHGLYVEL